MRVEGTLDLVELLVEDRHVTPSRAAEALERMIEQDRPIPRVDARDLIDAWRS